MTAVLNMILSVDLITTLRRPFQAPEKRYPKYMATTILVPLLSGIIRMVSFERNAMVYGFVQSSVYLLEIFIAVFSISYATWFLYKSGTNREAMKIIIFRHVAYIIVLILCQVYAIGSTLLISQGEMSGQSSEYIKGADHHHAFWSVAAFLFFGQGIFLTLVQLTESSFSKAAWYALKGAICNNKWCRKEEYDGIDGQEEEEIGSENSDLQSSTMSVRTANRQTVMI